MIMIGLSVSLYLSCWSNIVWCHKLSLAFNTFQSVDGFKFMRNCYCYMFLLLAVLCLLILLPPVPFFSSVDVWSHCNSSVGSVRFLVTQGKVTESDTDGETSGHGSTFKCQIMRCWIEGILLLLWLFLLCNILSNYNVNRMSIGRSEFEMQCVFWFSL